MTKQEFLAMSLPHKLKVYVKYNHKTDNSELETMIGIVDNCIITDMHEEDMAPLSISNYGLCLRPLSDLTKEIEHKGEKFVPIDRIKESQYHLFFRDDITSPLEGLQFSELRKLVKWHFDLFGGIENKEAINVNDLKTNPYK